MYVRLFVNHVILSSPMWTLDVHKVNSPPLLPVCVRPSSALRHYTIVVLHYIPAISPSQQLPAIFHYILTDTVLAQQMDVSYVRTSVLVYIDTCYNWYSLSIYEYTPHNFVYYHTNCKPIVLVTLHLHTPSIFICIRTTCIYTTVHDSDLQGI
jgi:hypothetical protein